MSRSTHDPKKSYTQAVNQQVKYLKAIGDECLFFKPSKEKSLECYVDDDFCGNWNKLTAAEDTSTAKSRTG